jgi:predicted PP-loop superfamily ATPase
LCCTPGSLGATCRKELGFGSGVTGWRRLAEWQQGGVWARLHDLLLTRLSGKVDWSRAIADSSHATMSLSSCRLSSPYVRTVRARPRQASPAATRLPDRDRGYDHDRYRREL